MKKAKISVHEKLAGFFYELEKGRLYRFQYLDKYNGPSVSLTMPVGKGLFEFTTFPPFFEGLLPEGVMLEGLLRQHKIDRNDYFSQLVVVGADLVGAVTVEEDHEYLPDNI